MGKDSSSEGPEFNKITVGFICQRYRKDSSGKFVCIHQEFVAGDDVQYENAEGDCIEAPEHDYQPFNMVLFNSQNAAESIRKVLNRLKARNGFASEVKMLNAILEMFG